MLENFLLSFFYIIYFLNSPLQICLLILERKEAGEREEREKERERNSDIERNINVREKHWSVVSFRYMAWPGPGLNLQPGYGLRLGIKPGIFWCMGWCSKHLSHLTVAFGHSFSVGLLMTNLLSCFHLRMSWFPSNSWSIFLRDIEFWVDRVFFLAPENFKRYLFPFLLDFWWHRSKILQFQKFQRPGICFVLLFLVYCSLLFRLCNFCVLFYNSLIISSVFPLLLFTDFEWFCFSVTVYFSFQSFFGFFFILSISAEIFKFLNFIRSVFVIKHFMMAVLKSLSDNSSIMPFWYWYFFNHSIWDLESVLWAIFDWNLDILGIMLQDWILFKSCTITVLGHDSDVWNLPLPCYCWWE